MQYNFGLLSGAYKNAGDYLIRNRSIALLKEVYPDCNITIWERNKSLNYVLDKINKCDALILAGGPVYQKDIYPNDIPLVENLDNIKTKICEMGLGWWNRNYTFKDIIEYSFDEKMHNLLKRIMHDTGELSCRDWVTEQILKNNGFSNLVMTGCPAWYSDYTSEKQNNFTDFNSIKKICVSDSSRYNNHENLFELVLYLRKKFKNAEIHFIFHRGIFADNYTNSIVSEKNTELKNKLSSIQKLFIHDISYSGEGFNIYNDCDIHIGFRVHAHIYNLSIMGYSILIEEDSRGYAANEAFGLMSIPARISINQHNIPNPYMVSQINNYINYLFENDFNIFGVVYEQIQQNKNKMIKHIKKFI